VDVKRRPRGTGSHGRSSTAAKSEEKVAGHGDFEARELDELQSHVSGQGPMSVRCRGNLATRAARTGKGGGAARGTEKS